MMGALANLFARKQVAGTLSGPIPDVVKPELAEAVAKLENEAETKVAVGDIGVAMKTSSPEAVSVTKAEYEAAQPGSIASTSGATVSSKAASGDDGVAVKPVESTDPTATEDADTEPAESPESTDESTPQPATDADTDTATEEATK